MARNTFWSIVGSVASQGSSLLAAFVVARILGVTEFGRLALIQATVLMMGTFSEMGFTLTTTKFVSRWRALDPGRAGRLVGWSLRMTTISAVVVAALFVVIGPHLGISGIPALSKELWAGSVLLVFETLNRVQFGALAGLEAFASTAKINVARGVLMLPCVGLGTWYGGLLGAISALAFVSVLTFAIGHWVMRRECGTLSIPLSYGGSLEPGILATSFSLWISALLMAGSTWAVTVLLARHPSGLSELGLYNAADKWRTALLFLPNMLFQVTLPMLSHSHAAGDYAACRRIIFASMASTISVTGSAAILVYWLSPVLMSSYGVDFTAGANVLSLGAVVAVVSAIYTVGSSALWAVGKPSQMLGLDFFKTSLLLGLCWMGFSNSAWNLMWAHLLTFSAGCAVALLVIRKQLGLQRA